MDYVFRVLGMEYLGRTDFLQVKPEVEDNDTRAEDIASETIPADLIVSPKKEKSDDGNGHSQNGLADSLTRMMGDAPTCDICGHVTVRNGSCFKCLNCGNSLGCS